jgi:hypothetical protein
MKKLNIKILSIIVLIVLVGIAQGQTTLIVSGRVIDSNGQPLNNALVSLLYPPCKGCIDHIIIGNKTNNDGFFIVDGSYTNLSKLRVFIEEKQPEGFWNPFFPNYINLQKLSVFGGIKLKVPKTEVVNLGEITPTVEYKKISIPLSTLAKNVIPDTSKPMKITAFNGKRAVIFDKIIPATAIRNGFLYLALPNFKWKLKISFFDNKNNSLKSKIFSDALIRSLVE